MPVDRGAIDAQLREIGESDRWWEQREFRDLPHVLYAEERIKGIVNGSVLGRRGPWSRLAPRWLIVATSQRLVCLKQERYARKQVEIPGGQITRIYGNSRLRGYQIVVETPRRSYRLRISKEDAFRFGAVLEQLMPNPQGQAQDGLPRASLPGVTGFPALPGVSGLVAKVSGHSRGDFATREYVERLETSVERLRDDVERLQQQVAFLEDLLQKRAEESFLQRSSAGSYPGGARG